MLKNVTADFFAFTSIFLQSTPSLCGNCLIRGVFLKKGTMLIGRRARRHYPPAGTLRHWWRWCPHTDQHSWGQTSSLVRHRWCKEREYCRIEDFVILILVAIPIECNDSFNKDLKIYQRDEFCSIDHSGGVWMTTFINFQIFNSAVYNHTLPTPSPLQCRGRCPLPGTWSQCPPSPLSSLWLVNYDHVTCD